MEIVSQQKARRMMDMRRAFWVVNYFFPVHHGKLGGANKGLGEAKKAARGRSMKARPTQSRKGVKGQLPLAGSRDSVPCGVWGNAPTVPRATSMPNALNKGAGSEASLPVTLRVRRRAPKLLFPQVSVKNQNKTDEVPPHCLRALCLTLPACLSLFILAFPSIVPPLML